MFIVNNKHTKLTINTPRSYRRRCGVFPSKFLVLQDVFSVTIFRLSRPFEDVLKTTSRLICNTSSKNAFQTSSQDVFKTFFKMSSRRFQNVFKTCLQDVFFKKSSRHLQDVFKKTSCNYALKTSWKAKNVTLTSYKNVCKTSSLCLHQDKCLLGFLLTMYIFHIFL